MDHIKTVEDDSGDEGRDEGGITVSICHTDQMAEKLQYQIWEITGPSKHSYILSYIVTGHSCDRVTECSTRFYMMLHAKVLSNYPRP